jgi:hypothetical protein
VDARNLAPHTNTLAYQIMAEKKQNCVYCNLQESTTDDHVPPKSFFPKPRPSNLITVPSCFDCNSGAGMDEEFFLATFMFSNAGVSEAGQKLWSEKLNRMYDKNIGLRRKIADHLEQTSLYTPTGIYLGRGMTINTDEKRFGSVVNKILKGLYFFEYDQPLPNNAEITTIFMNLQDNFEPVKRVAPELKFGSKTWNGIFEYRFNRLADDPSGSIWMFRFWGQAYFWSVTCDSEKKNQKLSDANKALHSDGNSASLHCRR